MSADIPPADGAEPAEPVQPFSQPAPGPDDGRTSDCFAPPAEPCECYCLHCNRVFMSDGIWYQKVIKSPDGFEGFWMCPTPNCGGAGFTFDIFPTDPNHPANEGWSDSDDDGEFIEEDEEGAPAVEYDPSEPKYAELDEAYGDDDDDLEGEEWKHGLEPGERPPEPPWVAEARARWEEEQKKYDGPDERPRELDWSDRPAPAPSPPRPPRAEGSGGGDGEIDESDIPF